jgi:hypothetical protein
MAVVRLAGLAGQRDTAPHKIGAALTMRGAMTCFR